MHFTDTQHRERGFIPSFHWNLLNTYHVSDSTSSWHLEFIVAKEARETQSRCSHTVPLHDLEKSNLSKWT